MKSRIGRLVGASVLLFGMAALQGCFERQYVTPPPAYAPYSYGPTYNAPQYGYAPEYSGDRYLHPDRDEEREEHEERERHEDHDHR